MSATIIQGTVFDALSTIKGGSVDCVVTSPPYWQLRSYLPKGHEMKPLELGSEKSPAEFISNQVRVFRLVRDAMADHATCWLNIGDTYCDDSKHGGMTSGKHASALHGPSVVRNKRTSGIAAGNMALIPQRLAIALQDDGWIVRSVVVWHKPAPMPASIQGWSWRRCRVKVKARQKGSQGSVQNGGPRTRDVSNGHHLGSAIWDDCPGCKKCTPNGGYVLRKGSWRPTTSWEPILMLAKTAGYFGDGEAVKQPATAATVSRDKYTRVLDDPDEQFAVRHNHETTCDDGANLRDVWTIASEPLREKHYAAFPSELVRRCLLQGTSAKGYCPTCGMPWTRIVEDKNAPRGDYTNGDRANGKNQAGGLGGNDFRDNWKPLTTIGWRPSCRCPASDPRPGLVLDPFCGSARTGITAQRLGLDFIGTELNPDYVDMGRRLLRADAPLFAS